MDTKVPRHAARAAWQIIRHFDGGKDPVALLRALILAHIT